MKKINYKLWEAEEFDYPFGFGFLPNVQCYLHEHHEDRNFILIVPGGGYSVVSPTEGEIVGLEFFEKGYNVAVLTYTTNLLQTCPLNKQPLLDISRAVTKLRMMYKPIKLVVCGFSAGAHLCGSLAVHYKDVDEVGNDSNRPDACILSYPVITTGENGHQDSFKTLLGSDVYEQDRSQDLEYFSIENHVSSSTPPCFVWHTIPDQTVPVENSIIFAQKLIEAKVNCSLHLFSSSDHGMSVANSKWSEGHFGEPYCMEQTFKTIDAVKNDLFGFDSELKTQILKGLEVFEQDEKFNGIANEEIAQWPDLANTWLENLE